MSVVQFPAQTEDGQPSRVETCIMQFGDDWPGVFIRGDQALHMAHGLRDIRSRFEGMQHTVIAIMYLDSLIALLESCRVTPPTEELCHGPTPGNPE